MMNSNSVVRDEVFLLQHHALKHHSPAASGPFAGYTYFGQMIAHDIVPETTKSLGSRTVTPQLNLDSLYGNDKNNSILFDKWGRFLFVDKDDGWPEDLLRDPKGQAIIPEPRNDENTVVSQLHLLFMKLHNLTIDQKWATTSDEARRLITLLFHQLVIDEYLESILDHKVYTLYFKNNERFLTLNQLSIPVEFSHAAFRFGHSTVRESYRGIGLNPSGPVNTSALFRRSKRLTNDFVIDWRRFFPWNFQKPINGDQPLLPRHEQLASQVPQSGRGIDTTFAKEMLDIPIPGGKKVDIVEMNLLAGKFARLPKGTEYIDCLLNGPNKRDFDEKLALVTVDNDKMLMLNERLSQNRPPTSTRDLSVEDLDMWPYILLEARMTNEGKKLGVLGSMIVAEVLVTAMETSSYSIYKEDISDWSKKFKVLEEFGQYIFESVRAAQLSGGTLPDSETNSICLRHLAETLNRKPGDENE